MNLRIETKGYTEVTTHEVDELRGKLARAIAERDRAVAEVERLRAALSDPDQVHTLPRRQNESAPP